MKWVAVVCIRGNDYYAVFAGMRKHLQIKLLSVR